MGNTVKEYSQMIGFLTRDKTSTVPRSMDSEPRNMYASGQLVQNTVDGSRPGYGGDKGIKTAIEEILETQTTFDSKSQLIDLIEEKVGYRPGKKIIVPNKYPILKKTTYKSVLPVTTEEQLIETFGKEYLAEERAKGVSEKLIRGRRSSKIDFANLPDEKKAKKTEDTRQKNKNLSEEQILDRKEKALVRRQFKKGYSFYKVNKAESLLWNDLLRTAKNKNGYFTFKGEAPVSGKYYNKAATENFVLVDKNNNEFKYSTLSDDITKHSGYKLDDVLRPYKQKEFLATEGLTKELNKLAGYELGSPKSVFHTQHIEGIDKNPWKVHLTFGDQNIKEAAFRKSFNADWKAATTLNDVGKKGDVNYKPGKKTAVKNYYKSLGPDIVAQIGKKPKGEIKTLIQLLDKTGIKLTDTQRAGATSLDQIIENIGKKDPKLAQKVSGVVFNSGLPVDQMLKEIRKIPGIDKLGRGFMKVGGPFEVAIVGLDAFNEFSKGKTGKQSLQTALSNLSFGAYEGGKREDMNVLLNTAENLNLDTAGFNELKEILDLKKTIEKQKKAITNNAYYEDETFLTLEGGEGSSNLEARQKKLTELENTLESKSIALQENVDIDSLVKNYTQAVDTVIGNQYEKSKESRADRVYPEMGSMGSDFMTTIMNPVQSFLPQNLMETNSITRPYIRAAQKIPFIGDFFKPTSDAAILSATSKDDRIKRAEKSKGVILDESSKTYYAEGGLAGLMKKYYD